MRVVFYIILGFLVFGCATPAAPNFFNGQYYMAGDTSCKSIRPLSETRVMCIDEDGIETGYRDAMTVQQIAMWSQRQAIEAQEMANIRQSIRQNNQALAQQTQQVLNQNQQYSVPKVVQPNINSPVTFTQVGNSYIGSNGVTYSLVGGLLIGSDGSSCKKIGVTIQCR